ncbi:MAG: malate dehydrogenase [Candidatus Aenigmarchaeota archaeon]|nr:malate dehydrogenase [Candidatus Aenigmarchaeota archaeon]
MKHKVSVIGGAGNVGSSAVLEIARRDIADVVMLDLEVVREKTMGKANDTSQAGSILGYSSVVTGTSDYEDVKDSDVVIITAGLPRKPGMSRDDLLEINEKIITEISENIRKYAPDSKIIIVTNPIDAMNYVVHKVTGFPNERVIGMAGELDTARFRDFLSKKINVSRKDIDVTILGTHGDQMVPVLEASSVRGIGISNLLSDEEMEECVQKTVSAGGDLTKMIGTSAWIAPGVAISEMVASILLDQKRVFSASVLMTGNEEGYGGVRDVCIGVPVVLGKNGLERVLPIRMNPGTMEKFKASVAKEIEKRDKLKVFKG